MIKTIKLFASILVMALALPFFGAQLQAQASGSSQRLVQTAAVKRHWYKSRKAKIIGGGAGAGALIGGLAGGGKGAIIGGASGAGAGYIIERKTRKHRR